MSLVIEVVNTLSIYWILIHWILHWLQFKESSVELICKEDKQLLSNRSDSRWTFSLIMPSLQTQTTMVQSTLSGSIHFVVYAAMLRTTRFNFTLSSWNSKQSWVIIVRPILLVRHGPKLLREDTLVDFQPILWCNERKRVLAQVCCHSKHVGTWQVK